MNTLETVLLTIVVPVLLIAVAVRRYIQKQRTVERVARDLRKRRRYKLADLLDQCNSAKPPPRVEGWDEMKSVGKENIDD